MINSDEIRKILNRDGLAEAEQSTGRSYKESEFTQMIGLMNHLEAGRDRNAAMMITGDTMFSNTLERYLAIARDIGFEIALKLPFQAMLHGEKEETQEEFFILWNKGILLYFDTYNGNVNSGNFYYNWKPYTKKYYHNVTSSGHWESQDIDLWIGSHDCREALRFHISELKKYGEILPTWKEKPHLWLIHWMDTKNREGMDFKELSNFYKSLTEERISMLSKDIRSAITPRS